MEKIKADKRKEKKMAKKLEAQGGNTLVKKRKREDEQPSPQQPPNKIAKVEVPLSDYRRTNAIFLITFTISSPK